MAIRTIFHRLPIVKIIVASAVVPMVVNLIVMIQLVKWLHVRQRNPVRVHMNAWQLHRVAVVWSIDVVRQKVCV